MILSNFRLTTNRMNLRDGISIDVTIEHIKLPISFKTSYYISIHNNNETSIKTRENMLIMQLMQEVLNWAYTGKAKCISLGNNKFVYSPALNKDTMKWYIVNDKGQEIYEDDEATIVPEIKTFENANIAISEKEIYSI